MRDAVISEKEHIISAQCRRHLRVEREEQVSFSLSTAFIKLNFSKNNPRYFGIFTCLERINRDNKTVSYQPRTHFPKLLGITKCPLALILTSAKHEVL